MCNNIELVAAAFILWGPLVIGGGAALKPRVHKSFGEEVMHVFADVVGVGRGDRQNKFIHCIDEIGEGMGEDDKKQVVAAAGEFMQLNIAMMLAVKKSPWDSSSSSNNGAKVSKKSYYHLEFFVFKKILGRV